MFKILLLKADLYKNDLIKLCNKLSNQYVIDSYDKIPSFLIMNQYDLIISTPILLPFKLKKAFFYIINHVDDLELIEKTYYTQIINGTKFYTSCGQALEFFFNDSHLNITFKNHNISYNDIVYISCCNRHVIVKTTLKEYSARNSLKNFEYLLDNYRFFKCHSSFIVNISYVQSVSKTTLYLKDGSNLPISRRYRDDPYITYFIE